MNKTILAGLVTFFIPTITLAATTPQAYVERSEIVGAGKQVFLYRIPTTDSNGAVKYYDATVTLKLLNTGKISGATVISSLSPNVMSHHFMPGTYTDAAGGVTCTVNATTLNGGREQAAMFCVDKDRDTLTANWITGLIAGHPFELDLTAAKIGDIPGYDNFAWGKFGTVSGNYTSGTSGVWWHCMNNADIISATQVGDMIQLSGYDRGNTQVCGTTLLKTPDAD